MLKLISVAVASLWLAGCATVTRGTTDQLQITSEPAAAEVKTSLNHQCITPCTITVSRKDEFAVTFDKAGYKQQTINVKTQLAGSGAAGFAGNILLGGIVGMGVDAATGSTLEHVPNPVHAVLLREGPARREPPAKRGRKPRDRKVITEPVEPDTGAPITSPVAPAS